MGKENTLFFHFMVKCKKNEPHIKLIVLENQQTTEPRIEKLNQEQMI